MLRNQDVLFKDLNISDFKVTEETRKKTIGNPNLPVRWRMGMFRTDEEKRNYIVKSLKRKLP